MCTIYISHFEQTQEKKYATEHNAGLKLLSYGLSDFANISFSPEELVSAIESGPYGKPYLKSYPDIHYNISHCEDTVVCAISHNSIGVDIESIRPFSELIIKKVFTEEEKTFLSKMSVDEYSHQEWFFRFWTLKEAYIKHAGRGLAMSMNEFSFSFTGQAEPYQVSFSKPGLFFTQKKLANDYILSLCTASLSVDLNLIYV